MSTILNDTDGIRRALALADAAEQLGEVPVGALVVLGGQIIGEGANQPVATHDPSAHAEIIALRAAGRAMKSYRLMGATLYVTLEPCAMCMMAMVHARLERVVFGAWDPRQGAAGSVLDLSRSRSFNHVVDTFGGVLSDECGAQLRQFFEKKRV
jgi:tRNA(adenine34) deaminase